jgi:hypothetical protein
MLVGGRHVNVTVGRALTNCSLGLMKKALPPLWRRGQIPVVSIATTTTDLPLFQYPDVAAFASIQETKQIIKRMDALSVEPNQVNAALP